METRHLNIAWKSLPYLESACTIKEIERNYLLYIHVILAIYSKFAIYANEILKNAKNKAVKINV